MVKYEGTEREAARVNITCIEKEGGGNMSGRRRIAGRENGR